MVKGWFLFGFGSKASESKFILQLPFHFDSLSTCSRPQ